jgi:hypothetical protein
VNQKITASAVISILVDKRKVNYAAVFTIVRIQRVHITFCTFRPPSYTDTFCRFGLNLRFVAFFDQGRLTPNVVFFPHTEHFAMA